MGGMEILNLFVGILAIILSISSLVFSYIWKKDAEHSLEKIEDKADDIKDSIDQRVNSLLDRITPSSQDEQMNREMGMQVFSKFMEQGNIDGLEQMLELANKYGEQQGEE